MSNDDIVNTILHIIEQEQSANIAMDLLYATDHNIDPTKVQYAIGRVFASSDIHRKIKQLIADRRE